MNNDIISYLYSIDNHLIALSIVLPFLLGCIIGCLIYIAKKL